MIVSKNLVELFACVVVGYLAIILALYLNQDKLLYVPEKCSLESVLARARAKNLRVWPEGAAGYSAFLAEPFGACRGNVIVFHGNAGSALDRDYYSEALLRLGYRVFLTEYPGYGALPGTRREKVFRDHGIDTADRVALQFDGPVFVLGESLGAAVAAAVAGSIGSSKIAGLVLITPWDTLPNLAQSIYWYLPTRWLVRDTFDTISNVKNYSGPIALLIAQNDEVIPGNLSEHLYESLTTRKRKWIFAGCGHNDWPTGPDEKWWGEVFGFLEETKGGRSLGAHYK